MGLMGLCGPVFSFAGVVLVDTSSMTAEEIAQIRAETLERTKNEIDYCLVNLGKNINEVDLQLIGDYDPRVCVITYGLIAQKYSLPYGDIDKAADYYYMEWKNTSQKSCGLPDSAGKITIDCAGKDRECALPTGEYKPFSDALGLWREAGQYKKAAKHYQEYFDDWVNRSDGNTYEEKLRSFDAMRKKYEGMQENYDALMKEWNEVKELAKTENPQLEPDVQHHEWFYSPKTAEVLKALDYYNKNRVRFMLEKAEKDKRPVVARKAKEYLDNWDKQGAQNRDKEPAAGKK